MKNDILETFCFKYDPINSIWLTFDNKNIDIENFENLDTKEKISYLLYVIDLLYMNEMIDYVLYDVFNKNNVKDIFENIHNNEHKIMLIFDTFVSSQKRKNKVTFFINIYNMIENMNLTKEDKKNYRYIIFNFLNLFNFENNSYHIPKVTLSEQNNMFFLWDKNIFIHITYSYNKKSFSINAHSKNNSLKKINIESQACFDFFKRSIHEFY